MSDRKRLDLQQAIQLRALLGIVHVQSAYQAIDVLAADPPAGEELFDVSRGCQKVMDWCAMYIMEEKAKA